ncbi:MAG: glycosyltransferase [Oleiphilaceae bacterium]|nr:glycosyltransferase [Oleiphilaceae bacterium]
MKVLHLIDSGGLYGAEKMLLALVAEQLRAGLEPMIFSVGEPGCAHKALEAEARKLNLPLVAWRQASGLRPVESRRILDWARQQGYQLLHSHGYKFDILLNLPFQRRGRPPMVATVHGYTATRWFSRLGLYRLLDHRFLRLAEGVAVVSSPLQHSFRGHRHLQLIHNGITTGQQRPHNGSGVTPLPEQYLLAIGRLSREKALDRLIRAFARLIADLPPTEPPLKLVIAGDGPERPALEALVAQSALQDRVLFYGFVPSPARLIHNARALVISSVTEGLPLTLLEAMREQTPVVATPVGEIPVVLEQGRLGFLSASTEWPHLADALEVFFQQPDVAAQKTRQAWRRFHQHYTAEAMEARYRAFYQGVLDAS